MDQAGLPALPSRLPSWAGLAKDQVRRYHESHAARRGPPEDHHHSAQWQAPSRPRELRTRFFMSLEARDTHPVAGRAEGFIQPTLQQPKAGPFGGTTPGRSLKMSGWQVACESAREPQLR